MKELLYCVILSIEYLSSKRLENVMNSIKAQDIVRHIFKDEDKGCEYIKGLSMADSVEVFLNLLRKQRIRTMLMMQDISASLVKYTVRLL